MLKNVKINYNKKWNTDGTTYTQTITIDKKDKKEILKHLQKFLNTPHTEEELKKIEIYSKNNLEIYTDIEDYKKDINFLTLTETKILHNIITTKFLKGGENFRNLLIFIHRYKEDRNTILLFK